MIFSSMVGLGIAMSATPSVSLKSYEVTTINNTFNSAQVNEWWKENNFMFYEDKSLDPNDEIIDSLRKMNVLPLNINNRIELKVKEYTLPILPVEIDDDLLDLDF